jgi:hypothetical protein
VLRHNATNTANNYTRTEFNLVTWRRAYTCNSEKEKRIETMSKMDTTTQWEKMLVSAATAIYLRGEYELWSRLYHGEHKFLVVPTGKLPPNDIDDGLPLWILKLSGAAGEYNSIASALDAKGLLTWKADEL